MRRVAGCRSPTRVRAAARRARAQRAGVRHPLHRRDRSRTGHRPRRRPGTGVHAARHDDGVRRQPHLGARRAWRARLRDRHVGGRACARDADPAAHAIPTRWRSGSRAASDSAVTAEGRDPARHRPDRRGGRHRLRRRIYRQRPSATMSIEGRLTVSNMSIEGGARAGLIAPDETTFAYLQGRPMAPRGRGMGCEAVAWWRTLPSDPRGTLRSHVVADRRVGDRAEPHLGHEPRGRRADHRHVPDPGELRRSRQAGRRRRNRSPIWDSRPGMRMQDVGVDSIFIGSCTNSRIEDLRAAAAVVKGRHVAGIRRHAGAGRAWDRGLVKRAGRGRRPRPHLHRQPGSSGASPAAPCASR